MIGGLIWQMIGAFLALYVSSKIVPGFVFQGQLVDLILPAIVLGLINHFVKPILNFITLPLRILTFGLFGFIINILIVWLIDILFIQIDIKGLMALFYTTLIVWLVGYFLSYYRPYFKRV